MKLVIREVGNSVCIFNLETLSAFSIWKLCLHFQLGLAAGLAVEAVRGSIAACSAVPSSTAACSAVAGMKRRSGI